MPAAIVTHTFKIAGTNGTSPAVDTTGSTLLIITVGSNNTTFTISDSQGAASNTYTAIGSTLTANGVSNKMFYCLNPVHVGANHTFSIAGGSFASFFVAAFSGIIAIDQNNGASYLNQTVIQPGTVTPLFTNELIVTGMVMDGGAPTSVTINGGYTITDQQGAGANGGGALAYLIQSSIVATNPTWTQNAAGSGGTHIATFKSDTSAAGGNSRFFTFFR